MANAATTQEVIGRDSSYRLLVRNHHYEFAVMLEVYIVAYEWGFQARLAEHPSNRTDMYQIVGVLRLLLDDLVPPIVRWVPREAGARLLAEVIDYVVRHEGKLEGRSRFRHTQIPMPEEIKIRNPIDRPTPTPKPEHPDSWVDRAVQAMRKVK